MNWIQYCKAATLTESIPVIDLDTRVTRLLHACVGFSGEYFEYKEATTTQNKLEELGDMPWYLAIIFNELGMAVDTVALPDPDSSKSVEHWLGMFNDIMHRAVFYNTSLKESTKHYPQTMLVALVEIFVNLYHYVRDQCALIGYDFFGILKMNIEKLAKRYPELAFDQDASNNKVEEVELSHIPEELEAPTQSTFYLTVQAMGSSDVDRVEIAASLALACSNHFRRMGAGAMADGLKLSYVKIMERAKWADVKEDCWQMYQLLYGKPNSVAVIEDNLRELNHEKCL